MWAVCCVGTLSSNVHSHPIKKKKIKSLAYSKNTFVQCCNRLLEEGTAVIILSMRRMEMGFKWNPEQRSIMGPILYRNGVKDTLTANFEAICDLAQRHSQYWRQNNHPSPLCWWHRWLSMRGRRTGKIRWASRQSLHSLWDGDQCREDEGDDK